MMILPPLSH